MESKNLKINPQTFTFVGGVTGLVAFLFVGLLPSLVYGGYAGVALAAAILGAPIQGTMARAFVAAGMAFGLLTVAGLFVVIGAIAGTLAFLATRAAVRVPARACEAPTAQDR